MKKIKQVIKLLAFVCLLFLAGIGIGLSGGVPIPSMNSKRDRQEEKQELMEAEEQESSFEKM